ncbi:3-oxoacyl-ACP reductase [Chryseobacterium piperi]|uniref:glucose 1-dehydrogenase n=1 Tax=Chryseobacterium piperi TaxID=558152 RepID=UPI00068D23F7|nr:glucose 1-dehydrogenase [Chryseobacterium piperi]ASW74329.1 3-oxoacyl-ACP reductase [Chryseobacterium piperi]
MSRLNGKVALVTGGARGIGAAIVKAFVAQGAKVVFGDILAKEGQAIADEVGPDATFIHFDVRDLEGWKKAVALTIEKYGKLNVLVSNAGIDKGGHIDDFSFEDWDEVINTNLVGYFKGIKSVMPAMKAAKGGSIINVGSTGGFTAFPGASAYVASYFGNRGLTKAAALDLGKYNIRVNSVHPGYIRTNMTAPFPKNIYQGYALERLGEPEELANLVVYLASDDSSYSTGVEFIADGGQTLGRTDEFDPNKYTLKV